MKKVKTPGCEVAVCPIGQEEPDFSPRQTLSYMTGVYVAINAIRDAFLLVEGPDCAHMKTQFLQGNHDYLSTLTSVSGFHRVGNTAVHTDRMAGSREGVVREGLERMAAHTEAGGVVLTTMPCSFITGVDYERLCRRVQETCGKEVIHVPGRSLGNDWLRGYEEALAALAGQLRLAPAEAESDAVAVVGVLCDRNEEDSLGNARELQRLLEGLGLKVASVWLSGGPLCSLRGVEKAGTILSLPYGRKAAATLARRLGRKIIETDLPFGLAATEQWVRQVSAGFSRSDVGEKLIERELARLVPKLEWVVPYLFQGRSFGFIGDPYLLPGFREIVTLVGGRLRFAVVTNGRPGESPQEPGGGAEDVLVGPKIHALSKFLASQAHGGAVDCVVTNSLGLMCMPSNGHATVEFGFPSYATHALFERPYLGFNGFLAFADTLANRIRLFEVSRALLSEDHGQAKT